VIDVATGDLLFTVPRASDARWVIRWSPRARRLLTADRDGVARIRDGDTGEVLTTLRGHEMSLSFAGYCADGGRIVTASFDRTAKVWDAATGRELLSVGGHAGAGVSDFRFLPETGYMLVVTSPRRGTGLGCAEVRNPADWSLVARFPEPFRSGSVHSGSSFVVSPDGALVAGERGGTVWNAGTGKRVSHSVTDADRKRFTAMRGRSSPDGRWRLEYRADRTGREDDPRVRVLDTATGDRRAVLEGHGASVTSARFGPAGRLVVTASVDRTAKVWDAKTGSEIMSIEHSEEVRDAAISPDGTFLVALSEGKLRRFPMDPFAVAVSLGPRPLTVAERRRFEMGTPGGPEESPASRSEPGEAGLRLYRSLLEELGDEASVRERLARDESLEPDARGAAKKIRLRAIDHARHLSGRSFRIAVVPGKTPGEYAEALRLARVASRLVPEEPEVLAALAMAMIRAGSVEEGVATLERLAPVRAEAAGHGIPTDSAFLALGYHTLGRKEEARLALAKYRELMKHPDYDTHGTRFVLVPLLREAEARLE
jgi:Flp pilus assembly protein TadD